MYVINLIPIVKTAGQAPLSYFSTKPATAGSIVLISLRKKTVPAIVLESDLAANQKALLRQSGFVLKKIRLNEDQVIIDKTFLKTVEATAREHAVSIGSAFSHFISSKLINFLTDEKTKPNSNLPADSSQPKPFQKPRLVLGGEQSIKKSLDRAIKDGAKKIAIVAPTILGANKLAKSLESYEVKVVHSKTKVSDLKKLWDNSNNSSRLIFICTPSFVFIPNTDWQQIIVTDEQSSSYKTNSRPFIDFRIFLSRFSENLNCKLTFIGNPPQFNSYFQAKQKELVLEEFHEEKTKLSPVKVINTAAKEDGSDKGINKIVHPDLLSEIKKAYTQNKKTFVFALRKGLATSVRCLDCGQTVKCLKCGAPIILQLIKNERLFSCRVCKSKRSASEKCLTCSSWNLKPYGIAVEGVAEELKKEFPEIDVFVLNRDAAGSDKMAQEIIDAYAKNPKAILVANETALPYLYQTNISLCAIASFETLFSIASLSITEKVFKTIYELRNVAKDKLIIQSKQPSEFLEKFYQPNAYENLYKEEVEIREQLNYPPFTKLVKIWTSLPNRLVKTELERLKEYFKDFNPQVYSLSQNSFKTNCFCLLKINAKSWPNDVLNSKISALGPQWNVDTNPTKLI